MLKFVYLVQRCQLNYFTITDKIMNNPVKILVRDEELTLDGICTVLYCGAG